MTVHVIYPDLSYPVTVYVNYPSLSYPVTVYVIYPDLSVILTLSSQVPHRVIDGDIKSTFIKLVRLKIQNKRHHDDEKNLSLGVPTRSNTNLDVQTQKIVLICNNYLGDTCGSRQL